jgi:hypothetical protein
MQSRSSVFVLCIDGPRNEVIWKSSQEVAKLRDWRTRRGACGLHGPKTVHTSGPSDRMRT